MQQGGQVALPWGPIIAPGAVAKHLHAGFHDAQGIKDFVAGLTRTS